MGSLAWADIHSPKQTFHLLPVSIQRAIVVVGPELPSQLEEYTQTVGTNWGEDFFSTLH